MLMSLKQTGPIRKYVKAIFRSSPWTFLIWRKRTGSSISWRGFNLRQNVQDLGAKQAASLLDWKYLAKGGRDQAKGKGLKYRKRQGPQEEAKPEAKKSELKIRSQSGPRRKKKGFICSKPLKKLRVTALKKKWKEFVSYSNWINGSSNWKW